MNVLVTGGAGYIGSLLSRALLIKGHKVTIVDNFRHGYQGIGYLSIHPNLEIIKRNILDPHRDYLQNKDFIFHLAALTSNRDCEENKIEAYRINSAVLDDIAYGACNTPILYTSTSAIYGDRKGEKVDTNSIIKTSDLSIYSHTKYAGERFLKTYDNLIILRLATIYGVSPLMRPHSIVNDFVRMAVQDKAVVVYDKDTSRPYMHILNCVNGMIFAMENSNKFIGKIHNFVGFNAKKWSIVRMINKHLSFHASWTTYEDPYRQDFLLDVKAFIRLGYKYKHNFDRGIHDLIKLYSFYD